MTAQEPALTTKVSSHSSVITTGLALFSMFFGAGNLIFPLLIGQSVGHHVWYAITGLALTAVMVPFLGLGSMVLFQANTSRFFQRIGKVPGVLLFLLLQLILGPFGVIPRLVVLMYATAKPYIFNLPLVAFSAAIALILFVGSFKRRRLISLLGGVLTPILLLSLLALFGLGIASGESFSPTSLTAGESFMEGLLGGYNTMDLIAAFLFATVVLPHFQGEASIEHPTLRQKHLLKKIFYASVIAAGLLLLTYIGLCFVSAYHGWSLQGSHQPEELLGAISLKLFGPLGGSIAATAVITACLTTAITLTAIFAEYLQKDICRNKINKPASLLVTLLIMTLFANLGFSGLASFLSPILQISYPALIVLSLFNLLHSLTGMKMVKIPVYFAFGTSTLFYLLG